MTTLLIDADPYIYQSALASERVFEWDEDQYTYSADLNDAKDLFKQALERLLEKLDGSPVLCLTDEAPCFRRAIYAPYKASRGRRPILYKPLREWVLNSEWRTYLRPALEADDILGILATHPKIIPGHKIMVSDDKDLRQVPGKLYVPREEELVETGIYEGYHFFMTQVLTGDQVDNYPGCPGIGAVKAAKLLSPAPGLDPEMPYEEYFWDQIVAAYEKAGLTEDDALVQARCARILQHQDYDFDKKEPRLWEPK